MRGKVAKDMRRTAKRVAGHLPAVVYKDGHKGRVMKYMTLAGGESFFKNPNQVILADCIRDVYKVLKAMYKSGH